MFRTNLAFLTNNKKQKVTNKNKSIFSNKIIFQDHNFLKFEEKFFYIFFVILNHFHYLFVKFYSFREVLRVDNGINPRGNLAIFPIF